MALLEPTRTDLDIESLLPVVYRIHDEARRRPLASLLEVIGEQAGLVKGNIDDLWDDFFIETCADWVIPYIGDLVGNNLLPGRIRRPRADVAKTIYYRRRKGTLPMLEELARDVTLWRAHAVPFFELANWTQNLNHLRFHPLPEPRPPRPRGLVGTASVRDPETAELVDGPFDVTSHSVDIRPVARREGWPALRRLGFFLWRLGGYPLVGVKPRTGPKPHLFHFNPLGLQTQLFTSAAREAAETELAEEVHVPAPIRRIAFHRQLRDYYGHVSTGSDATRSRSVAVYRGKAAAASTLVPPEKVVARNLSKWELAASLPAVGEVAIDVRLGRLAFNDADVPADVRVSYTYGFSADIGGGPYTREIVSGPSLWTKTVRQTGNADFDSVAAAVLNWESEGRPSGTITVLDSPALQQRQGHRIGPDIGRPAIDRQPEEAVERRRPAAGAGHDRDLAVPWRAPSELFQARGNVHRVADRGVVDAAGKPDIADQHRAGMQPDAHAAGVEAGGAALTVEHLDLTCHRQRALAGGACMIGVGLWRAPEGHQAVADVFVDGAAGRLDRRTDARQQVVEVGCGLGRRAAARVGSVAFEVAEQDGDGAVFARRQGGLLDDQALDQARGR